MDYTELTEALIYEASFAYLGSDGERLSKMMRDAADAIEELQRQIDGWIEQERKALLKSVPKWIPVTERLPENDDDVLCYYEYYHWSKEKVMPEYGIGHCWNGRWGGEVANGRECKVLAWIPLPEPPKEGEG